MSDTKAPIDPSPILQTAFAFWSSKVLLTAVEFGVFTQLDQRRVTGADLGRELGLHPRGVSDFFDALVAMKFLDRQGEGPSATYFNTPEGVLYLDRNSPRYVGGWLVMLNTRLFKFWNERGDCLQINCERASNLPGDVLASSTNAVTVDSLAAARLYRVRVLT